MPCRMSHASIPAHIRAERALPEDLIRLCLGIEDVDDLLEDLYASLVAAGALPIGKRLAQNGGDIGNERVNGRIDTVAS